MYYRELQDYFTTGEINKIKFDDSLKSKIETWSQNMFGVKSSNDSTCINHLKHSKYLRYKFLALGQSIMATQKIFNATQHVKKNVQMLNVEPLSEYQTLLIFFKYQNMKFEDLIRGVKNSKMVLEEAWLVEKIFSKNSEENLEDIGLWIEMLECTRLVAKLEFQNYVSDLRDYVWNVRYNQELPTFYFYLSMIWSGVIISRQDLLTGISDRIQPWRISGTHYLALDFAECLSSEIVEQEIETYKMKSKYVSGRVLPVRFPNVKQVDLTSALDAVDKKLELINFTYTQFIQLDSLKSFIDIRDVEVRKQDAVQIKKYNDSIQNKTQVFNRHLYKSWDQLIHYQNENRDESFLLYDLFRRDLMQDEETFPSSTYKTMRESVIIERTSSQKMPTFWLSNTRIDNIKFFGKEMSEYNFNGQFWHLPGSEIIKMASKYANNQIQEFPSEKLIIQKLSDQKNSNKLLTILEQIPNLKIKLSPLQEAVVVSNDNLLCLGRSGTGKTTSSVLRLFSQEIMYILLRKQTVLVRNAKKEDGPIKITLSSEDLMKPCNMKTVFISASPVLVNEVSRFYYRLKEALVHHLKEKEYRQNSQKDANGFEEIDDTVQAKHDEVMQLVQMEAELIEEELASQQQFDMPNAFEELKANHFPLFVTVKQLLYMFDASLTWSFFSRDLKNNLIGMASNLTWHNENKGLFMINSEFKNQTDFDQLLLKYGQELIDEYDDPSIATGEIVDQQKPQDEQAQPKKEKYYYSTKYGNRNYYGQQQLSFEVDFEIFEQKFYTRFSQKNAHMQKSHRLSAAMIWTEIFSVIKGGLNAQDHYQGFLTAKAYVQKFASPFLQIKERQTVYWIFIEYEIWKKQENAFDQMDLVQHILTSGKTTSSYYINSMRMDYLMIDEVQDLTPKTLQLLLKLTTQRVYFAGDTAQTIAKGVGARFSDLKTLLQSFGTRVIQLTTNYRSHGQILALANSVVSLLETLFPFSIDSLAKEESETTGMKPLILMPMPAHDLRTFFLGSKNQSQRLTIGHSAQKPQFGCNQVVIVREQSQKENLPDFLKNMLCLTVFEAKGLEFDDVILYNFFNSGEIQSNNWKLINEIQFKDDDSNENQLGSIIQGLENLLIFENQQDQGYMKKKDLRRQVMINKSTQNRSYVYRKFASLCIELKQLYVAITRPKLRLIIYDDDVQARLPIQRVWDHLKVCNIVSTTMIEQKQLSPEIQQLFQNEEGCFGNSKSKPEEWKIQGIKFYKKKQFDQAMKCFNYAGEEQLATKCHAYQMADSGNTKIAEADTILWRIKTLNSQKNQKSEKKLLMKEQGKLRLEARKEFEKAGTSFYDCNLKTQSASCFYTARKFQKAAQVFEELGQYGQAGECLMQSSNIDSVGILRAAEMFERGNLITRAIECYERIQAWEKLLISLYQSKNSFKQAEREQLAHKYIPIALNKLYLMMMGEEKVNEANQGALTEIKIKKKYAKQVQEQIIEEEEEYFSEDSDSLSEQEQESQKQADVKVEINGDQMEPSKIQNDDISDNTIEVIDEEKSLNQLIGSEDEEEGYDILDDVFELKKKRSQQAQQNHQEEEIQVQADNENQKADENQEEASFEIIDDDFPQQKPNAVELLNQSDFEHLSNYDPDDEFLQSSESYSLLQSILQNKNNDQSSEYSIIDDSQSSGVVSLDSSVMSKGSIRFIKSQRKVEDAIIKKIIYYISLFSDEVRIKLLELGKNFSENSQIDAIVNEEDIRLSEISPEFVEVVLNILEHYELIKLCLILCNRFKLTEKLGRYVVTSCLKYQSLQTIRFTPFIDQLCTDSILNKRIRQQSLIAHEALHNVLTLVAPNYLTLKGYDEKLTFTNSLGMDNYQLMFALGFWKKLVYTMNLSSSIDLCYKFTDMFNFNVLMEDRLSVDLYNSDLHQCQNTLIILKHVNMIISKHALKFKQIKADHMKQFIDMFDSVQQELQMLQIDQKNHVQDLVDLVSFILLPELKEINQVNSQLKIIANKIAFEKEVQQNNKLYQFYKDKHAKVTQKGIEIVQKSFSQIEISKKEVLIQSFLAYMFLTYQTSVHRMQSATKDANIFKNLVQIYKSATQNSLLYREALYASANCQALDCSDFLTQSNHNIDDNNISLYSQYYRTHVLVSVHSQWIEEFGRIQRRNIKQIVDVNYIMQGSQICKEEFQLEVKEQKIKNLRSDLERKIRTINLQTFMHDNQQRDDLAFVIDMDLQYLLVPINWIKEVLHENLYKFQTRLYESWNKVCLYELQNVQSYNLDNYINVWTTVMKNNLQFNKKPESHTLSSKVIEKQSQKLKSLINGLKNGEKKKLLKNVKLVNFENQLKQIKAKKLQQNEGNSIKEMIQIFNQFSFESQRIVGTYQYFDLDGQNKNDLMTFCSMGFAVLQSANKQSIKNSFPNLKTVGEFQQEKINEQIHKLLNVSLRLMNFSDQLPYFIDCIKLQIQHNKVKKNQESLIQMLGGVRMQAYALISYKNGFFHDAVNRQLLSYNLSVQFASINDCTDTLLQCCYTLITAQQEETIIPIDAIEYLDSDFDIQAKIEMAAQEDNADPYLQNQAYDDKYQDDQEYYDEWDRPEIEEVKNLQLEKRPSQQPQESHQLIQHKIEAKVKIQVDQAKTIVQIKDILDRCKFVLRDLNINHFDKNAMLKIFNLVMSICVNVTNITPFVPLIKQIFEEFDKSCLQDYFIEILFQYTNDPKALKKMFIDTEDHLKFQFFANKVYLVNLKVNSQIQSQQSIQPKNSNNGEKTNFIYEYQVYKWLARRDSARIVVRKCLKSAIERVNRMKITRDLRPQFIKYKVDQGIYKINQNLPQVPVLFQQVSNLEYRLTSLQNYYIAHQSQVSCFEIQLLLQKYQDYQNLQEQLISKLNQFISSKWEILNEFDDIGDIDTEIQQEVDQVISKTEIIDAEIIRWSILSESRKNVQLKEDEVSRTKRMKLKWQAWDDLSRRKERLQNRINKLKEQSIGQ